MERHCLRQFAIAERLAGNRAVDRELLLCACWLHDAGLYIPSRDPYVTEGARLADRVLAPFGWPPERLQRCMDACEQHHAPRSRMAMGLEVELVRQADLVDVTRGIVNFGLDRRWLGALFRDVPRDGFWRLVGKSFRSELSHRPASLIGVFVSPRRTHVPTLPGPEIFLGGRGFILTGRDSPGKPGREHGSEAPFCLISLSGTGWLAVAWRRVGRRAGEMAGQSPGAGGDEDRRGYRHGRADGEGGEPG